MNEFVTTKGIILKTSNLGEYDKRLVALTEKYGKITIFARGVRRQGSRHLAACSPFSFGEIKAFPSREAYSLMDFTVEEYFEGLRRDFEISCMAMYFLEVADFYTRENNDELAMMKLLFVSLRTLERIAAKSLILPVELVRYVFEMKAVAVNGEFEGAAAIKGLSDSAAYALYHIASADFKSLYAFTVSDEVLCELSRAAEYFRGKYLNGNFKSLEILQ